MNELTNNTWPAKLPFEIALGKRPLNVLLDDFGINADHWRLLCDNRQFKQAVGKELAELRENGVTFKHKAQIMAEDYLLLIDQWIHSSETPLGTKIDLVKSVVGWGDLNPKKAEVAGSGAGTAFNIQINMQ